MTVGTTLRGRHTLGRAAAAAWLMAVLGLVLVAAAVGLGSEPGPIGLAPLPSCSGDTPQLTVLVLDVSSSVISPGGADPKGRSFIEAKLLAEHLSDHPCSSEDRMGAVIFADNAVEVPPINTATPSVLVKTLDRPPENELGGGTRISIALEAVDRMRSWFPEHTVTTVLLSDMQDSDSASVAGLLAASERSGMHLIALGEYDPQFNDYFDSVTTLDSVPRGAIAQNLNSIISNARGAQP